MTHETAIFSFSLFILLHTFVTHKPKHVTDPGRSFKDVHVQNEQDSYNYR